WFHVTHRGGYFGAHNHPLHTWSRVYCVSHHGDDPNGPSERLTFINPFTTNTMFFDISDAKMKAPYAPNHINLRLTPGQRILFPSWLLHEVTPYEGDDVRITVAFNSRFRMEGVARPNNPVG